MGRSRVKHGRVGAGVFQHRLHQLFLLTIAIKGAHALIELAGGIALYLFSTDLILRWLWEASQSEDWIARFAQSFSKSEHEFYAFYLVSHGVVNAAIVAGLLLQKRWSYHATFVVLTLFIAYQLYRYSYTHEIALIALSVFDVFVIYLAAHEYRLLRKHLPTH